MSHSQWQILWTMYILQVAFCTFEVFKLSLKNYCILILLNFDFFHGLLTFPPLSLQCRTMPDSTASVSRGSFPKLVPSNLINKYAGCLLMIALNFLPSFYNFVSATSLTLLLPLNSNPLAFIRSDTIYSLCPSPILQYLSVFQARQCSSVSS